MRHHLNKYLLLHICHQEKQPSFAGASAREGFMQCPPPTECPSCALTLFNVNGKRRLGGVYQRRLQVGSVSSQFLLHAGNQFHTLLLGGTHRHTPVPTH